MMKNNNEVSPKLGHIRTNSGVYIDVFNPKEDLITIEDIAHALANQPRFGGHLNRHYSVGQHSVLSSLRAETLEDKKAALLHDGTEAYLLDMPKPIKDRLPDYQKCEDNLMRLIAKKFGIKYPLSPNIKKIDKDMLMFEWDNLVISNNKNFKCWGRKKAKRKFLKQFNKLFKD